MTVSGLDDLVWRKSSRSGATNDCVEIALGRRGVALRDSKNPYGAVLRFEPDRWTMFLQAAKTKIG